MSEARDRQQAYEQPRSRRGGTHIDGVPLEYAQLQEEVQLDLALLEQLLHLGLRLVQLLQHRLDVANGAVVGGLVTGDGGVPVKGRGGGRGLTRQTGIGISHCQIPDPAAQELRGKKAGRKRDCWPQKMGHAAPPAKQHPASSS